MNFTYVEKKNITTPMKSEWCGSHHKIIYDDDDIDVNPSDIDTSHASIILVYKMQDNTKKSEQVYSRGMCSVCNDHVWTNQLRGKNNNGYIHDLCYKNKNKKVAIFKPSSKNATIRRHEYQLELARIKFLKEKAEAKKEVLKKCANAWEKSVIIGEPVKVVINM
jgi:hypothetical protein